MFIIVSCQGIEKNNIAKQNSNKEANDKRTRIYLFQDSTYITQIHSINEGGANSQVIVELIKYEDDASKLLLQDTLNAFKLEYDTMDLNNDGLSDLLILRTINQSNPSYYAFIVDTLTKNLRYVVGFENIYTPEVDKENNLVISYLRSGNEIRYAFYRLDDNYKLIDLHEGFTAKNEDQADRLFHNSITKLKK
jgi:hypothetical protein